MGMKDFISKKNLTDLDMGFVLDRLSLVSPYGERHRRNLKPYRSIAAKLLEKEYDKLSAMITLFEQRRADVLRIKEELKRIKLLDGSFDRILQDDVLTETELFEIKQIARTMASILKIQETTQWQSRIGDYQLKSVDIIIELLDPEKSGTQTFHLYSAYSKTLSEIRAQIEQTEVEMKRYKLSLIEALANDGFLVQPNGDVRIKSFETELLIRAKNDERLSYKSELPLYKLYTVKPSQRLSQMKENLLLKEEQEEYEVRSQLTKALKENLETLTSNTDAIGWVDLLIAKAQFSIAFRCVRPMLLNTEEVVMKGARHIKVAIGLEKQGKTFTPIDVSLKNSVTLITGANMGGKTVSLKLIGLMLSMAQYGFFVPCDDLAFKPFDYIFISVGDFQSIDMGLSTFGGEIVEIEQAIKRTDEYGLILIDELARGTNPLEGFAISKALIEYLTKHVSKAVITTHFDGLTHVKNTTHYQVKGLSDVDLNIVRDRINHQGAGLLHEYMDYRLVEVSQTKEIPKEAIRISELMGLNKEILDRAKEILGGSNDE